MSKPYPPRFFRRRNDDSIRWKYENQTMWAINKNVADWFESGFYDPDHLLESDSIEEIDSEGRVIADENDGPEWDEHAMMNAGELE
jgi:hypothetical protein